MVISTNVALNSWYLDHHGLCHIVIIINVKTLNPRYNQESMIDCSYLNMTSFPSSLAIVNDSKLLIETNKVMLFIIKSIIFIIVINFFIIFIILRYR